MSLTNETVAKYLIEIGVLMRLAGENEFRARAFDRAARAIETLGEDVNDYIRDKTLTDIPGIGKSIAIDIHTLDETGQIPVLVELTEKVPAGLLDWLSISGLGPKGIYKIHSQLGITTLDELRNKCEDGSVAGLPGMGQKSADKILRSMEWAVKFGQRSLVNEATEIAEAMYKDLAKQPGVEQISVAGSLRRGLETVGDIDFLIAADKKYHADIFHAFTGHDFVTEILGLGDTKSSVRTAEGRQVDLRIVSSDQFAAALMYFTGSKEHNVGLRQRARKKKMTLNEYGLYELDDNDKINLQKPLSFKSESDIYRHLDLGYVPPELREDRGEFEYFSEHDSADFLIEEKDIKGILHAHSTWSDGKKTIREMSEACMERGYSYLGLSDHSRTAAYAGGLTIESIQQQWREIDSLNEAFVKEGIDFRVFKGIESDILPDGSLDYPDDILKGFDFVIASVHASLEMPADKMTDRYKRAIANPYSNIIGHPTGRLLLRREGSKADLNELITFAAEHNTAIETNTNPNRLDMDWRYGQKAREVGLMTAICPDAHRVRDLDYLKYGVKIARKGWYDKDRVLNTRSATDVIKWFKKSSNTVL
ncbi:MAG: DNA polymerase/3'-5' exonuclease PolX [Balneolales bacterium]